jgi:hypothetical protein
VRHHERTPADQASAKQRRGGNIITVLAEWKGITGVGNGMRGETAVPCISGEEWTVAEIFHAVPAEAADAAGITEPGDTHALADPVGGDAGAEHVDPADNFVARDNRIFYAGQFAIEDMKVRHTPQALTLTRISPVRGSESARSCICSATPGAGNAIARIARLQIW